MLFTFQNWRVFLSPRTKEPVIIYRLGVCVCVCVGGGGSMGGSNDFQWKQGRASRLIQSLKGGGTVEYWLPVKDVH